jgi:hypothetical protein
MNSLIRQGKITKELDNDSTTVTSTSDLIMGEISQELLDHRTSSEKIANPSSDLSRRIESDKLQSEPIHNSMGFHTSPRTASHTTLCSSSNEPFQFDADSRCPSLRSQRSTETSKHSIKEKQIIGSPVSTSFVAEGSFPTNMGFNTTEDQQQENDDLSTGPQHDELDPDLSLASSFTHSLNNSFNRHHNAPQNMEPPPFVLPRSTHIISPMVEPSPIAQNPMKGRFDAHTNVSKANKRWHHRKVQPLVYSAIGSLEAVHQSSFGSFNERIDKAATRLTTEKKKKSMLVDVNSNTSQICARQEITQEKTPGKKSEEHVFNVKIQETKGKQIASSNIVPALGAALEEESKKKNKAEDATKEPSREPSARQLPKSSSTGALDLEVNNNVENMDQPKKTKKKRLKKKRVRMNSKSNTVHHIELFRPSCDAYTPRIGQKTIKYKPTEQRMQSMEGPVHNMGTIQKPNFQDALRRVAMIIQQHIVKIERRFQSGADHLNLFKPAMRDAFSEENFVTPRYKCTMVNVPMARGGVTYGMRKIRTETKIPSADDIYEFGHRLFKQVQLSSECSIICLIYVERLMEAAKVPLLAKTWKPIFMAGLLLASKVWQDWSSWNIEFANVYPQFSLEAINKLELQFLKMVKWDLYISSSLYAKYYFALRSILEKNDFRRRYNQMVGGVDNISATQAMKISKRTEQLKEQSLACLSKSV